MNHVTVIGAGLAGSECAWQLAQRGIPVTLREMKPEKMTPAHQTADFAELCCSNSLRAAGLENAVGLLKEELRQLGSPNIRRAGLAPDQIWARPPLPPGALWRWTATAFPGW